MTATRRFYLPILGDELVVDVPVPAGEVGVTAALPAARAVSGAVMARAIAELPADTKVSCKAGCSACCRHLVIISVVEARALLAAIESLPTPVRKRVKARFATALEKLERAGWLEPPAADEARRAFSYASTTRDPEKRWLELNQSYIGLGITCPFLEQDRCVVYASRPFACREYLATTDPVLCETVADGMSVVPRSFNTSVSLTQLASEVEGEPYKAVPLPLALEWVQHNPAPDVRMPGAELLEQWWSVSQEHWYDPAEGTSDTPTRPSPAG